MITDKPGSSGVDALLWRRVHRQLTLALIQSRDNISAELTQRRYLLEEMNRCKFLNNTTQQKSPTSGSSTISSTKSKKTTPASKMEKAKTVVPATKPKPKKPKLPTATVGDYLKVAEKMSPSIKELTKIVAPKTKASKVQEKHTQKESTEVANSTATTSTTTSPVPPNVMAVGNINGASSSPQSHDEQSSTTNVSADVFNGGELLMSNLRFAGMTSSQPMGQVFCPPAAAAAATVAAAQYGLYGEMTTLGTTGLGMATPEQMRLAFHLIQQMNHSKITASNDGDGNNRDGEGNTEWP